MNIPPRIRPFWEAFCAYCGEDRSARFLEAFHFDDHHASANALAALVLAGSKRATASLLWGYQCQGRSPPRPGDLSVLTWWDGTPVCVIETLDVELVAFEHVTADFAASEGEGDGSLAYWRRVHWDYFGRECTRIGRVPSQDMPVLCERFRVVYDAGMARNVEIKARVADLQQLAAKAAGLATQGPVDIHQDDTFFPCPNGRLKLRAFQDGTGELIFYRRADCAGPKESFYLRTATPDPDALREALGLAYSTAGRVITHRILYIAGRTRIHLDEVRGLGSFAELEVVLSEGESAQAGALEAQQLMRQLGIDPENLVEEAYIDLLSPSPRHFQEPPRMTSQLRVDCFSISLDGYGAGIEQTLSNPLGVHGEGLHGWMLDTRSFRKMIGAEGGSTGVDNDFVLRGFENVGAWILGRNMFGPVRGPWPDESWKGWWGPNPPYHVPVFVLTHHARAPIEMEGGTTFHFVTGGIRAALQAATAAAAGKDVRVGGGVATIHQYLREKLIDRMHLALSPVLLGAGESLFQGMDLRALGYACVEQTATEKATHLVLQKKEA